MNKKIYENPYVIAGMSLAAITALYFAFRSELVKGWLKPIVGRISSPYGTRVHPVTGQTRFHNGIDLAVPTGTPIKSPMKGVVEASWYDDLNGNGIRIRHANGFSTHYAHLDQRYVKKGDKVKKGKTIGTVGNTGRSTGSHLHLSLKDKSNNYVNPEELIYKV